MRSTFSSRFAFEMVLRIHRPIDGRGASAYTVHCEPMLRVILEASPVDAAGRLICIASRSMEPVVMDPATAAESVRVGTCLAVFRWAGVFRGISASSLSALAADPTADNARAILLAAATRAVPLEAAPIHAMCRRVERERAIPTELLGGLARDHLEATRDQGVRLILGTGWSPFACHLEDPATAHVFAELDQVHALRDVARACESRGVQTHTILDFSSTAGTRGVQGMARAIEAVMRCFREPESHSRGLIVWPVDSDEPATALSAGNLLAAAAGATHEPRLLRDALARTSNVNADAILIYV
jgi:hypothetical protein